MNTPIGGAPPATWSISGSITPSSAGSGASVSVTGPSSATTTADVNGNYTVNGLPDGTYTVTPSKGGFTFAPVDRSVSVSGASVSGINFTGTAAAGIRLVQNDTRASTSAFLRSRRRFRCPTRPAISSS